ncbi:MAG TPA: hypothetical protein VHX59_11845 [Mycobacteriales bacterium]|jgi:hypothetical protein|nr:hypothetical protein [Mycobacteriales bacterium]
MSELSDPVVVLRTALDTLAFDAERGHRPPSRLIQGTADQIWKVVRSLRARTRHEYMSFDDPSYLVRCGVPERIISMGPSTMRPMIDRGVQVRQITTRPGLVIDEELGTILWSRGAEARVVDRLPFKAGVLDRKVALIPADLSVFANGMLVVTDPILVRLIITMQRRLWSAGGHIALTDGPPAHLRPLLPMLASGESDTVAAAAAGMSARTYSRHVAQLMTLLGVHSRFQAGAEAVRRGWL